MMVLDLGTLGQCREKKKKGNSCKTQDLSLPPSVSLIQHTKQNPVVQY